MVRTLNWGLSTMVQITVSVYLVVAIWTAWKWCSRWLRISEVRERHCASDWPTWYAPEAQDRSFVEAAENKGGVAVPSWQQSLEATCRKFSNRSSSSQDIALIPKQPTMTSKMSSAAASEVSWAGPHHGSWTSKLCKMRSRSQPAMGKKVLCEEVPVSPSEEYEFCQLWYLL